MPLDLRKLNTLKLKMTQEPEIRVVYTYYFDHFGDNPDFLKQSTPTRHALLEAVVRQAVGDLLGAKGAVAAQSFMVLQFPGRAFYHGGCIMQGKMVNFIYFDDIKMGCIAVAMSMSGAMQFARFSAETPPHQARPPMPN